MEIFDGIENLSGIGEKRLIAFNDAGIFTLGDIVEYYPRDYDDRSIITPVSDCYADGIFTIKAKIAGKFEAMRVKKLSVLRVWACDDTGGIFLVWFNMPYMKNAFKPGLEYVFTGKVSERAGRLQMESPEYEMFSEGELINAGRIVPVYSRIGRLSQKNLRAVIRQALDLISCGISEILPNGVLGDNGLSNKEYAVRNIHFPESRQAFFDARKRLVFEELLMMQLTLFSIKGEIKKHTGIVIAADDKCRFYDELGFMLTDAQRRCLCDIEKDMFSGFVMNRLVQGDVGSGKTAVGMAAAYNTILCGYQAVLMAPTEVLAEQHYASFCHVFGKLGIKTVLLTGGLRKKDRETVYREIESGCAQMIIGTHALIEDGVYFKHVGLVITDEQHRFGVLQRGRLSAKGNNPHVLVMTATPIPRTLALILYGDLDISIIDELPPGRKTVDTFAVSSKYRERIYGFIKSEISKGRQAYVICPMIEDNEGMELKSVLSHVEELNEHFNEYEVACLHGKMKNTKKQEIMEGFARGQIHILVSTTVIEVGINVPNATVMLIENAERFGLSQLHQLRGRVGRGKDKSYCILISDSKSKVAKERLGVMTKTCDGFEISEMDLKLRGHGDYFGTRQHGLPEFKIANLYKDLEILAMAQHAAERIIREGLLETDESYTSLKIGIEDSFKKIKKISL